MRYRRFLAWADTGAYTPHGDGRFDIGNATASAFARLRRGVAAEEADADPDSQGNGSLMRILPIVLVDPPDDAAELIDRAHRSSAITHGAPECLAACAVYVLVASRLAGRDRDRPSALASDFTGVEATTASAQNRRYSLPWSNCEDMPSGRAAAG